MRPFDYVAPASVGEAVAVLVEHGPAATILAGGTDLMVDLKGVREGPEVIVDITRIPELKGVELTDRGLRIGALATHTEIIEDPLIARHAPAMISAASTIGAVQTRNMGTLGGNLVTCVPSLDSGPVLVALDAEVTLAGPDGRRSLPITDFFVGPRSTALGDGEMLVEVVIPSAMLGRRTAFWKFGLRKGQALALVNAAAGCEITDGALARSRIALGAVAPTVVRAREAESLLDGVAADSLDDVLIGRVAEMAVRATRPIDDFRASAEYRRHLIRAGVRRVVSEMLEPSSIGV